MKILMWFMIHYYYKYIFVYFFLSGRHMCPISEFLSQRDIFPYTMPGRCLCTIPEWCFNHSDTEHDSMFTSDSPPQSKTPLESLNRFQWNNEELQLLSKVRTQLGLLITE